jgi:hydroxypyruvate isomerase
MKLRFAPNLTMLYNETPFLERFARAAAAGFTAVEFLFPYEFSAASIKSRLDESGLRVVLFNINPGDWNAGERGALGNPARRAYFRQSMQEALDYAAQLGCPRIHTMAGNRLTDLSVDAQRDCALENLAWAAPLAAQAGVTLLIEPLNATDMPAYLIHSTAEAMHLVRSANHPAVKLQYDVYHAQMTEGNLINTMTALLPYIGHIQISDVPGRHQPGTGEINYPAIFAALERLDYQGFIGLEYRPNGETDATLRWLPREARGA